MIGRNARPSTRSGRRSHAQRTRRDFLVSAGSFVFVASGPARAAMSPDDKFDLLIKGGDVLDPSQSLRGRRDIGTRYGLIEAVESDIPATRAACAGCGREVGDARID